MHNFSFEFSLTELYGLLSWHVSKSFGPESTKVLMRFRDGRSGRNSTLSRRDCGRHFQAGGQHRQSSWFGLQQSACVEYPEDHDWKIAWRSCRLGRYQSAKRSQVSWSHPSERVAHQAFKERVSNCIRWWIGSQWSESRIQLEIWANSGMPPMRRQQHLH